jgi:hypothetical protein
MHRAVRDVPNELRGISGARETSSWCAHALHLPLTCRKASVLLVSAQANGSLFWLPRVALGWPPSKLAKVCDDHVECVYRCPCRVLTLNSI